MGICEPLSYGRARFLAERQSPLAMSETIVTAISSKAFAGSWRIAGGKEFWSSASRWNFGGVRRADLLISWCFQVKGEEGFSNTTSIVNRRE